VSDKPRYVQELPPLDRGGVELTGLCRVLLANDDAVGAVRAALAATGRLGNTIFVYAGDNGMNTGEHRLKGKETPYVTAIPFYMAWPDVLGTVPRTIGERLQNIDFAPTICDLLGCTLGPYPNGQQTPDGISFKPLLLGTATSLSRDAVLDEMPQIAAGQPADVPPWYAVTTTGASPLAHQGCASAGTGGCRWHYVEYKDGERELYDDSGGPCYSWTPARGGDPCELSNLLFTRPSDPTVIALAQALHTRLLQLEAQRGN
jgi:hypothetical protein